MDIRGMKLGKLDVKKYDDNASKVVNDAVSGQEKIWGSTNFKFNSQLPAMKDDFVKRITANTPKVDDRDAWHRINSRLQMFEDKDKDGVLNIFDCQPYNKKKQGFIHDLFRKKQQTSNVFTDVDATPMSELEQGNVNVQQPQTQSKVQQFLAYRERQQQARREQQVKLARIREEAKQKALKKYITSEEKKKEMRRYRKYGFAPSTSSMLFTDLASAIPKTKKRKANIMQNTDIRSKIW